MLLHFKGIIGKGHISKLEAREAFIVTEFFQDTLHIDWKSETAFCIRQLAIIIFKISESFKRFSSSVTRLTENLFFFRNKLTS